MKDRQLNQRIEAVISELRDLLNGESCDDSMEVNRPDVSDLTTQVRFSRCKCMCGTDKPNQPPCGGGGGGGGSSQTLTSES
jgi:hypothetical protein